MSDVLALSDLIAFLLELMRDPAAAAEFERDPDAALAERGLEGVTAQDVRDARLELCDAGGASATGDAAPPSGDDPVREINHTASNYSVSNYSAAPHAQTAVAHEHSALALQAAAPVTIDDRDTFVFNNEFSDDDTTIVNDSFNADNSVDNSVDAVVDNSVVNNDVTAINDSFNSVDNSVDNSTVENDVVAINAENSFNDSTGIGDVDPAGPGAPLPVEPDGGTGGGPGPGEDPGDGPFPVEADGGTGAAPEADADPVTPQIAEIDDEPADADPAASDGAPDQAEEEPVDVDEAFDPVA